MAGRGLLGSSSTNQMMNSQGPIGMPNYSANQGNNSSLGQMFNNPSNLSAQGGNMGSQPPVGGQNQQPMTFPTGMTFGLKDRGVSSGMNQGGMGSSFNQQNPFAARFNPNTYGNVNQSANQISSQPAMNSDAQSQYLQNNNMRQAAAMQTANPQLDALMRQGGAGTWEMTSNFGDMRNQSGMGGQQPNQMGSMQQPMSSFGQSAQQPVSTNPFTQAAQQTANANLYGAQQATSANRINQSTPYGNLQYTQTGTDQFGNPMWSANQNLAPELQGAFGNLTSQLSSQTANPFNASKFTPQKSIEGGGMEGWDKATNLLMSRLNPQIEQGQDRLKAQLANQGIVAGTEAYDRAMTLQGQKENDLRTQAQIAGSTVQNQMFNQNLLGGQFGNQAQSQDYLQSLGGYNLPLSQLNAFRTATSPNYINPYQQAATAGPDYLGAYTSSEAARIANMNAEAAKQAALTGGLFQMGGSILSNPQSLKDIYGLGKDIYGAGSSAYDYLKDLF